MLSGFTRDISASKTARLIKLNPRTVKVHFAKIRQRIQESLKEETNLLLKDLGVDPRCLLNNKSPESFKPNAFKKFRVLAVLYLENGSPSVVSDILCLQQNFLYKNIEDHLSSFVGNEIVDFGFADFKFNPLPHVTYMASKTKPVISIKGSIEMFWDFARVRKKIMRGITDPFFYLHLKETEWRFNNVPENYLLYYLYSKHQLKDNPPNDLHAALVNLIEHNPL